MANFEDGLLVCWECGMSKDYEGEDNCPYCGSSDTSVEIR